MCPSKTCFAMGAGDTSAEDIAGVSPSDTSPRTLFPKGKNLNARVVRQKRESTAGVTQKLSVIIPVKNGAVTLPALLDALHRQQLVPGWQVEVVAGVTPSDDNT